MDAEKAPEAAKVDIEQAPVKAAHSATPRLSECIIGSVIICVGLALGLGLGIGLAKSGTSAAVVVNVTAPAATPAASAAVVVNVSAPAATPTAAPFPNWYLAANASTVHWGFYSRTLTPKVTINSGDTITVEMCGGSGGSAAA